jgi:hypothetical protein
MDIGGWLRSLGLEQYEAAFCGNEIDDGILPTLTAEDLKDLGVAGQPPRPRGGNSKTIRNISGVICWRLIEFVIAGTSIFP